MVVGSFTSVSLDPPLVGFLADHKSTSWPRIRAAGRFCANVLSAEQEYVCRAFIAKLPDRFDVHCQSDTPNGSPLLSGTTAWIDCTIESVTTAGDHDIIVGRVCELAIGNAAGSPLLFLRGGYGAPLISSVQAQGPGMTLQLRFADLARPEIQQVAADLSMDCTASAEVDGAIIVLSEATAVGAPAKRTTRVGTHVPLAAPLAPLLVAWAGAAEQNRWIERGQRLGASIDEAFMLEWLARLRQIGYWLRGGDSPDLEELVRGSELEQAVEHLPFAHSAADPVSVHVPVFGPDGSVALMLGSRGFGKNADGNDVNTAVDRLLLAARRVMSLIDDRHAEAPTGSGQTVMSGRLGLAR
jgi:flavin reductase (DIM6/NTAB) family NADH-FMN oxidoreductase RutF